MGGAADKLTSSRLARAGGVNLETVRYYERKGLLPKPPRTASGYRIFPADAARRLHFIKRAQELGFSLKEIRDLLSLRICRGTSRADIRGRATAKVADIDEKIGALKAMRKRLLALSERCDGCGPLEACPILESFDDDGKTKPA
jgi:MerR family mercuric resistance operon transcriptional regulator